MKKVLNLALILITLSLFTACERDRDIEYIENILQSFIKENKISKCTIIVISGGSSNTEHQDVDFTIENGFVIVKANEADNKEYQEKYNLKYISEYMYDVDNNSLLFYFKSPHS